MTTLVRSPMSVRSVRRRLALPVDRRALFQYLAGVVVCSVGAGLAIQSGLGASPYDAFLTGISVSTGVPFWIAAWMAVVVFAGIVRAAGGKLRLTQFVHGSLFGPVIGATIAVVPAAQQVGVQIGYLVVGTAAIAAGVHLFLSVKVMSGVLDALFETVGTKLGCSSTAPRLVFDVLCVGAAALTGGSIGVGTFVVASSVAPMLAILHRFGTPHVMVESWRGIRLASPNRGSSRHGDHEPAG